jgi:hypothetical protein
MRIIRWNEDWQGKPKYSEKTCPSATLCTINPTWPDPGLNPARHSGKPATNRLSYGAAKWNRYLNDCETGALYKYLRTLHMITEIGSVLIIYFHCWWTDNRFFSLSVLESWKGWSRPYSTKARTHIFLNATELYEVSLPFSSRIGVMRAYL